MADLAGNLLIPDDWTFVHPVFVDLFEPLPGLDRIDAAMASDGTIYVLYTDYDATLDPPDLLRVAFWDGFAWTPVGGPVTSWQDTPEGRLLMTSLDQPIVVHRASAAFGWDGSAWTTLASLAAPGSPIGPPYNHGTWDARVAPGDQVLLAREAAAAPDGYDVLRAGGGAWTTEASLFAAVSETRRISLLPTSDGFVVAYRSGTNCVAAESTASGLETLPSIHTATECWDLMLERDADGAIYAGITRFLVGSTGPMEGVVLVLGADGWEDFSSPGDYRVTALAPWNASLVVGTDGFGGAGLTTATEAWLGLPDEAHRILIRDGVPLVFARDFYTFGPGTFHLLNLL
jgi:hypothetical protein